jgi:predicted ATPase/class 3 adenylate cyclase/DNA-binding CsgD family transcriptional regulator
MNALPTGTVTFLFTDIEGSTRLLEAGQEAYRTALVRHDTLLAQVIADHGGMVVQQAGDGFSVAFRSPTPAVRAALDGQAALQREPWEEAGQVRVRMALHTGEVELQEKGKYFGQPLHRCARLMDSAHGGQVLLSAVTAALVGESLPTGAWLKDLGEHRLRDLVRTERVYQLVGPDLPADFPPLRTLTTIPNNLPMQATAFIGREQQLQAVRTALLRTDTRLVTLTGPGGTGKTRLALQAAADLLDSFRDGVYVVALASVTDPDLVASAIAQALDVREVAGRPITTSLGDALRQRRLLLVLDNFEQVAAAAPTVAELLGSAPRLKILVTSRSVLHVYGERELSVPPLALPDHRTAPTALHLAQFEAVHLFVDRAQAARSDFALVNENASAVAEICQRLDGLPLAIELAAARVRALPPRAMLQRMERRLPLLTGGARDLPARQRTLRDAIAWSYDLLEPDEQTLFRRLAVFRGCTLEAAESVCAGDPSRPGATSVALPPLDLPVLDGIESLVEKSLLLQEEAFDGQPWYSMLETVREFALERLEESGESDAIHRRHALAALTLAESSEGELYGAEQTAWLQRLEQEHDNLRSALRWCEEQGFAAPALRLAVALWWFWSTRGHVQEGREHLTSLLDRFAASASGGRAELYARALYAAGMLASWQGDHAVARARHQEGLAIRRQIGEPMGLFTTLEGLGMAACLQGDYVAARRYMEEALALVRDLDDRLPYANVMNTLGNVSYELGDLEAARAYYEQSIASFSESYDPRYRTLNAAMIAVAVVVLDQERHDEAHALATRALVGSEETGNWRMAAVARSTLGGIALARGDLAAAREHLSAAIATQHELGDVAGISQVLERFVELAAAQDQHEGSLRLAAAATTLHERTGAPLTPSSRARLDRALEPSRRSLSPETAETAWQAGRALDLDQIVEAALSITEAPAPSDEQASVSASGCSVNGAASVLSRREQEVAVLIARGLTNRQIAEALVITEGTAANHVNHILSKLGHSSRAQVAVWAVEVGLVAGAEQI